jgi:hypothetical protein
MFSHYAKYGADSFKSITPHEGRRVLLDELPHHCEIQRDLGHKDLPKGTLNLVLFTDTSKG